MPEGLKGAALGRKRASEVSALDDQHINPTVD